MKKIFVDEIIKEQTAIHGIAVLHPTVFEILSMMFTKDKLAAILTEIVKRKESAYFFLRFYQFIAYVQFQLELGWSIKLSNYYNTNAALDDYLKFSEMNWQKEDKDKIMKIFMQIEEDKKREEAILIIKDHLPYISS